MLGRWINVAVGVWLCVSAPFVAGEAIEVANGVFVGLAIFLVAFLAMGVDRARRLNTFLGLWAMASPFALGYVDRVAGLMTVLLGAIAVAASLSAPGHQRPTEHPVG